MHRARPALEKSTATGSTSGWQVRKINGNDVAHAGSHLIHQAAGLAKVDVLCPLADLRDLDGGDFIGHEAVIQDHADQHFKGSGGRNAAAFGHVGGNVHIQTGQLCTALTEGFAFAAQQREGSVFLFLAGSKSSRPITHRS